MHKTGTFTKILAIVGTVLIWFPILAPVLLAVGSLAGGHGFRFDYLMPAELFPVVLLGAGLLLWAAFRARAHGRLIGWGLAAAVGLLVGGQAIAVVTGLASGAAEPEGWRWGMVLASIVGYVLSIIAMGVGGLRLLRDLFKSPRTAQHP
jgi:hypothetical protein